MTIDEAINEIQYDIVIKYQCIVDEINSTQDIQHQYFLSGKLEGLYSALSSMITTLYNLRGK